MDDQELRRILRGAERPRTLTDAERARARRRLGLAGSPTQAVDESGAEEFDPVSDAEAILVERAAPSPMRFDWRTLALACAVVLLAGVVVVLVQRDNAELDVADRTPTETANAGVFVQPCSGPLAQLTGDIESWRGIENWAFATNVGDPDLAVRLDEVFVAFGAIDEIATDVAAAGEQFRNELAAVDDGALPLLFQEARGREIVLRQGIDDLLLILGLQPLPEPCDVDGLRAALEQ